MENNSRLHVLRRRSEFLEITRSGKRISPERWLVLNYIRTETGQLRCGWTIPKQVGNAVIRNRLRRWCREVFRKQLASGFFGSLDINVFVRPVNVEFYRRMQFADFKNALEKGLGNLRKRS